MFAGWINHQQLDVIDSRSQSVEAIRRAVNLSSIQRDARAVKSASVTLSVDKIPQGVGAFGFAVSAVPSAVVSGWSKSGKSRDVDDPVWLGWQDSNLTYGGIKTATSPAESIRY